MNESYIHHLISLQREQVKKSCTKESVAAQFAELLNAVDQKTLEYLSCQLSLLQSFMKDGDAN